MTQSRAEVNAAARRVRAMMIDLSAEGTGAPGVKQRPRRVRVGDREGGARAGGAVAHVSAWNCPAFLAVNVLVPALLAGNAVLHKPSEVSHGRRRPPGERSCCSPDVPPDVFQVCRGGRDVGRALVRLQGLGAVASHGVLGRGAGTEAAAVAGRGATPDILELGGVDAAHVRPDVADVELEPRASLASGAFHNAGPGCCASSRSGSTSTATCTKHLVEALVSEAAKL